MLKTSPYQAIQFVTPNWRSPTTFEASKFQERSRNWITWYMCFSRCFFVHGCVACFSQHMLVGTAGTKFSLICSCLWKIDLGEFGWCTCSYIWCSTLNTWNFLSYHFMTVKSIKIIQSLTLWIWNQVTVNAFLSFLIHPDRWIKPHGLFWFLFSAAFHGHNLWKHPNIHFPEQSPQHHIANIAPLPTTTKKQKTHKYTQRTWPWIHVFFPPGAFWKRLCSGMLRALQWFSRRLSPASRIEGGSVRRPDPLLALVKSEKSTKDMFYQKGIFKRYHMGVEPKIGVFPPKSSILIGFSL